MQVPFLSLKEIHEPLHTAFTGALNRVLERSNYILGPECEAFETAYSAFNNTKYTVATSNGLDAIILALRALEIGPGDEVIVPAHTYIATWLAVTHTGATIIPVDACADTCNINVDLIEQSITPKTKAIIPVHLYGQACRMDKILALATKHNLHVIEDNAQSQGATCKQQLTGTFGIASATSFYPGKNIGALGDAGAITTSDSAIHKKLLMLRNYGSPEKYVHTVVGYNNRMDEMQAAFLSTKLPHLPAWNAERNAIAKKYNEGLQNIEGLTLPLVDRECTSVYHLYVLRTKKRKEFIAHMAANGITCLIHYPTAVHLQPAYKYLGFDKGTFPVAEEIADTCVSLPLYPGITQSQIEYTIETIKKFYS
jgi:dTDP-4-amino-4,6-dideoxygalactose transaminase